MQIGRKIYYEKSTGNVILDTGERQGDVIQTTIDQDFVMYAALKSYQQSAVGVMQLNYGQYASNFSVYPYSVDITQTTPTIKWDTQNPFNQNTQSPGSTVDDRIAKLEQDNQTMQQTINFLLGL